MERYIMFLGYKTQYCENDYTIQSHLQIQCNTYQISMAFFRELEQKTSQFVWKHRRLQIAKAILRKNNGAGGSTFLTSDYTTKLQSSRQYGTGTKEKYRLMEQDRKPINPCTSGHFIFYKGGKNMQWRKDSLFNKWCWENWTYT